MTIEELEPMPIIGNGQSDRELFNLSHDFIAARDIPRAVKLRALSVVDRAVGGTGQVDDPDLANYMEETLP